MEWSIYSHLYYSKKAESYLLYSSLSNMIVELDNDGYNEIVKIKEDPNCIDIKNERYKFLFDSRFIVQSNEIETNKLMLTALSSRFNTKSLSLTIAPTRACNFSCPYCYEEDRANKKMSKEVQDGILDFVKKYDSAKSLHVTWYGGEPTVAIDVIKYLSGELEKHFVNYSAFMVTNGFLLDKIIDDIELLKIKRLQITLDGTKETHDQTRHLINGNGTFDKILSNIDNLLSKCNNVKISIRMNISKNNSNQFVSLNRMLQKRYGNKVNLYPAFVHDYNGSCQAGTCYDNGYTKALFLKKIFDDDAIYTKDLFPTRAAKGCMSQNLNAFLIGPEGELYKCWHHLGVKEKEVGSIFEPQIITNYGLLSNAMIKGDPLLDNKCKSCVLFPSCFGGCVDNKNGNDDFCIPAKSMLEDFIDTRYTVKTISTSNN